LAEKRSQIFKWKELDVSWQKEDHSNTNGISTVLIHGFGANKYHWRKNQKFISKLTPSYSIDLIGFGESSQPQCRLNGEPKSKENFFYNFDNWAEQISDFSQVIVKQPVLLIGNSIGGVIALRAAHLLGEKCKGVILINCAQRLMDDKQLIKQSKFQKSIRPILKSVTKKRWLSKLLFKNAANQYFIKNVLKTAYPTGQNVDKELINLLYLPSQRSGASEAFHGFINIFNDYLAPDLMKNINIPVHMIWGEDDPWESVIEAKKWFHSISCIKSLKIISKAGHCPHDEAPDQVNPVLQRLIQQAT